MHDSSENIKENKKIPYASEKTIKMWILYQLDIIK